MSSILDWVGRSVKSLMDDGYPESVAKRISSGELPMDEVSRQLRADAMSDPRTFYHGGDKGITEFDPSVSASKKTEGTGLWVSDDPILANTYLPPEEGMLYPLRILTDGMYKVDAQGSGWNNIDSPLGGTVTTDQLARAASKSGEPGVIFESIVDPGPNFKMAREAKDDFIDWRIKHEEDGATNLSVNDPTRIRSVNAAFDPEYRGPNILGSLAALGVGGAALNSQDALAVEAGMPMAMQAAGQSGMNVDPGRDFGNAATIMDFLLPLVAESVKPAMMGNAELTDEQRRRGYYNGM